MLNVSLGCGLRIEYNELVFLNFMPYVKKNKMAPTSVGAFLFCYILTPITQTSSICSKSPFQSPKT